MAPVLKGQMCGTMITKLSSLTCLIEVEAITAKGKSLTTLAGVQKARTVMPLWKKLVHLPVKAQVKEQQNLVKAPK